MTTIECHCLHLGDLWLNAGIRTSSQPTLYVGWDGATAESQQSESGDHNYALYTTPAVGWANGSIVNPTLIPSSVGCEKHAAHRYLSRLKWAAIFD